jgi:hypothetical protein
MRTDELIGMLGTNVEPVKATTLRNVFSISLGVGALATICLMLAIFGVPPTGAAEGGSILPRVLALGFTLGLTVAGASFLIRSARPGEPGRKPLALVGLLFVVAALAGVVVLALTPSGSWRDMLLGPQWTLCLICIPLFAVAPFAALVWALRQGAPTSLARTGAAAGLVAGALGAAVFALHYPSGSIPFIALWYGGPIVLCALVGAIIGPRLLRW